MESLTRLVPQKVKENFFLMAFGFFKVPLIFYCRPSIVEMSDARCEIKIPLNRRTKNHLNSMYFGSLCVGADCAGGMIAMRTIQNEKAKVALVFKDIKGEFLKRPEGDVHFSCEDGLAVRDVVRKAIASGERENVPVHITATVPTKMGTEPVAKFTLTLSLKRRS